jgi:hypothetical protein
MAQKRKAAFEDVEHLAPSESSQNEEEAVTPGSPKGHIEKKTKVGKKERKRLERERAKITIELPRISLQKEMEKNRGVGMVEDQGPPPLPTPSKTVKLKTSTPKASTSTAKSQVEPPAISEKQRGKRRAVSPPSEDSTSDLDSERTESDVEMETEFVILEMDKLTTVGNKISYDLVKDFKDRPPLYFKDHMAPFRGLMSDMKLEKVEVKNRTISELFKRNFQKKILVATSGMNWI